MELQTTLTSQVHVDTGIIKPTIYGPMNKLLNLLLRTHGHIIKLTFTDPWTHY